MRMMTLGERRLVITIRAGETVATHVFEKEIGIRAITCPILPEHAHRRLIVGGFDADLRILHAESIRPQGPEKIKVPPLFRKDETGIFCLVDLDGKPLPVSIDLDFYLYATEAS